MGGKSSKSAKKRRGKVVVRTGAKIRKRSSKSGKNDTIQSKALTPHDNAATLKVKIRRK